MAKGVSAREMGRRLGVSHVAVLNAARDGRIPRNTDGTFTPALVKRAWARNTDIGKPRNRVIGNPKIGGLNGHDPTTALGIAESRAVKVRLEALLAEHEYKLRTGKVIEREAVEKWVTETFIRLRDRLLAIPDRMDAIMAAELDRRREDPTSPSETHRMLSDEINAALTEMTGSPLP